MEKTPTKLLEQVRDVIRVKHYSYKTEKSYINWIKRYILFHNKRQALKQAVKMAESNKRVSCHTFRQRKDSQVKIA